MRFYFDNCISEYIARGIGAFADGTGVVVTCAVDKFPSDRGGPDPKWLGALAAESQSKPDDRWVILSADPSISHSQREKQAWRESGLTAFFFTKKFSNSGPYPQFREVVNRWQDIVQLAKDSPPGSGFTVPMKGGPIRQIYTPLSSEYNTPARGGMSR